MENCCVSGKYLLTPDCPLLNWNDRKFSGMVFLTVNLAFVTLWLTEMTLFTFFTNIALFYIISGMVICSFMEKDSKEE